jgi:acylphosphatase
MKKTCHYLVSGRVHGVCFRMDTEQQAHMLGVTGWVRNLPDGRVEVMATANENTLNQFKQWLKRGPEMAKVLDLTEEEVDLKGFDGFRVR